MLNIPNTLPSDLLTLNEASQLVSKSKNTIRYYIQKKKLTKYTKNPNKQNSPVLVSRSELLSYCSINSIPEPTTTGRKETKTASVVKLHKDSAVLEAKYAAAKREIEALQRALESKSLHLEDIRTSQSNEVSLLNQTLNDTRIDLQRERDRNENLHRENMQLKMTLTKWNALPWYKKFRMPIPLLTMEAK